MKLRETADIRIANLQAVWEALQRGGAVTRTGLAAATGLSLMSISNLVEQLGRSGLVCAEAPPEQDGRKGVGRRAEVLRVDAARVRWLVLDLTDPFFQWELVRLDRREERGGGPWPYDGAVSCEANLRAFLRRCRGELAEEWASVGGIGVVAPGPYDPAADTIVNRRVAALNDLRLKQIIGEELGGKPIFVDEDVKFAARAYAEQAGAEESLYYLYAGEGVGGALVYQGSIFRSLNSVAGDPSLLGIFGVIDAEEGLSLRAFAARLGLDAGTLYGKALLERFAHLAQAEPARYEAALAGAADDTARLLRVAQAMLDPHAVVVDCLWARPMRARFLALVRERLRPALPLRRTPRVLEPALPLHAPWYGAVKVLEKSMIRQLKTSA